MELFINESEKLPHMHTCYLVEILKTLNAEMNLLIEIVMPLRQHRSKSAFQTLFAA